MFNGHRLIMSENAQNLYNEIVRDYTSKCDVGVLFKAIVCMYHSKYKEKMHNNRKWNVNREIESITIPIITD